MEELLNDCQTIVDESHLTTNDAKKILNAGCKLLQKTEELRISRDNWRNRFDKSTVQLNTHIKPKANNG